MAGRKPEVEALRRAARNWAALLLQLPRFYPDLLLDAVAGDAGCGYEVFLRTVYTLGAKRVVEIGTSTGESATRPTMPVDYDVYAEGEARLGWLNATLTATAAELPRAALDEVKRGIMALPGIEDDWDEPYVMQQLFELASEAFG